MMPKYYNRLQYIQDQLSITERGIRLLLHHFESRETAGDSSLVLRGLVITPADIERTLEMEHGPGSYDPLEQFRLERIHDERMIAEAVSESLEAGLKLPLAQLAQRFKLSVWELRCVVLLLAAEIDSRWESWFGYLNDDVTLRMPTAELALSMLGDRPEDEASSRQFLGEGSVLRRYLLQQTDSPPGRSSLRQILKLDARIVGYLLETERLDKRLSDCAALTEEGDTLPSMLVGGERLEGLAVVVRRERGQGEEDRGMPGVYDEQALPFLQIAGPQGAGKKLIARHLARALKQPLLLVRLDGLLAAGDKLRDKLQLLIREAVLTGAVLAFEEAKTVKTDEDQSGGMFREIRWMLDEYMEMADEPAVLWLTREERRSEQLPLPEGAGLLNIALTVPDADQRLLLWTQAANGGVDLPVLAELADKYKFTPGQIEGTMRQARRGAALGGGRSLTLRDIDEASRNHVSHRLSELADRLKPSRAWDDLVLPEEPFALLKEACSRYRNGETVYSRWGFGQKLPYGRGLSMLFAGPPGTGKTMAAEVVAKELGLELYRIDLSRVVSKYIGETEKNLRELFAEAENSGSILFFDEGDALFGKRTEVKDSHDRYANMEAAYLLQRIEAFDGVSILATNLQQNMDEAFMRRMQTIIQFPFPDKEGREHIFRGLLPKGAPLDPGLDLSFLADRIEVSGGHIKNIVLSAAFLAAGEGMPIGMSHMIRASRQELQKMGKIIVKESFEPYL
ncbi:ATP-binding protein [Paenibacillus sp. NPDC058174]|uniref:ATP-binding protein n=1 Tax=Paenibacillus sp. NPDC058174 TaxID=3346366 RepID=UPI0036DC615B